MLCCCVCWPASAHRCLHLCWGKPLQHRLLQSVCSHKTIVAKTSRCLKRCWLEGMCMRGTAAKCRALKPVPTCSCPLTDTAKCYNPAQIPVEAALTKWFSQSQGPIMLYVTWYSWDWWCLGNEVGPSRPCQGNTLLCVKTRNLPGLF